LRLVHKVRRKWETFAERTGLRLLPPVGAALAVVALGVTLPFVPAVDALPQQLAPSLASARVERFLRAHPDLPDAGPVGPIYTSRPAFFWPERPGAESYVFRLRRADGVEEAAADGVTRTFHVIPPPGRLDPGEYLFEVFAVEKGERTPWRELTFSVRHAPEELQSLLGTMGIDLNAADSEYVLIGCYAELQSPHDVISAFLQWKTARGEAASLGKGPPSVWLKTLAAR